MSYYFTSESVCEGHPDKIADKIADYILDSVLKKDPNARCAVEVALTTNFCLIFGEVTTSHKFDYAELAKAAIKEIGYTDPALLFSVEEIEYLVKIKTQSPDIALGVDKEDQGAGDQGIMFGYAEDSTPEYLPPCIYYAHKLSLRLTEVRKQGIVKGLRPDGKTQVTAKFSDSGELIEITAIVVSAQHEPDIDLNELKKQINKHVIQTIIPACLITKNTQIFINATGRFVIGGPHGDSGLTGRKIIVDTYGGTAPHGGGAFSGKDPSKVDRSASYMARYLAKNIVAAGLAHRATIEISYCIGVAQPTSLFVTLDGGTNKALEQKLFEFIKANFDLSPKGIIQKLNLKQPLYSKTAISGHFGNPDFPWEQLDSVSLFQKLL